MNVCTKCGYGCCLCNLPKPKTLEEIEKEKRDNISKFFKRSKSKKVKLK